MPAVNRFPRYAPKSVHTAVACTGAVNPFRRPADPLPGFPVSWLGPRRARTDIRCTMALAPVTPLLLRSSPDAERAVERAVERPVDQAVEQVMGFPVPAGYNHSRVSVALLIPDATPASRSGTEPITMLATVGKHSEVPTPATVSAAPSSA